MDTVGAYEAKTYFPKLLKRVAKGERIVISKHGVPVAVLQPFDPWQNTDIRKTITELQLFRKKNVLRGDSIRNMIEEGRR